MQEQAKAAGWLLLPFVLEEPQCLSDLGGAKAEDRVSGYMQSHGGSSGFAWFCLHKGFNSCIHTSPLLSSHTTWKAGEADLSLNSPKNKLWTSIKSEIPSALEEAGWFCLLPGKAARGGLHSGSQIQGRKNTQKKMIMGVLKTCPFLPSLGQYLQGGLMNKQTFFSG